MERATRWIVVSLVIAAAVGGLTALRSTEPGVDVPSLSTRANARSSPLEPRPAPPQPVGVVAERVATAPDDGPRSAAAVAVAVPRAELRPDAVAVSETCELCRVAESADWSPDEVGRAGRAFLEPESPSSWEAAFFALRLCPDPDVIGWMAEFVDSEHAIEDRTLVLLALGEREEGQALAILERQMNSRQADIRLAARDAIQSRCAWDQAARRLEASVSGG